MPTLNAFCQSHYIKPNVKINFPLTPTAMPYEAIVCLSNYVFQCYHLRHINYLLYNFHFLLFLVMNPSPNTNVQFLTWSWNPGIYYNQDFKLLSTKLFHFVSLSLSCSLMNGRLIWPPTLVVADWVMKRMSRIDKDIHGCSLSQVTQPQSCVTQDIPVLAQPSKKQRCLEPLIEITNVGQKRKEQHEGK